MALGQELEAAPGIDSGLYVPLGPGTELQNNLTGAFIPAFHLSHLAVFTCSL